MESGRSDHKPRIVGPHPKTKPLTRTIEKLGKQRLREKDGKEEHLFRLRAEAQGDPPALKVVGRKAGAKEFPMEPSLTRMSRFLATNGMREIVVGVGIRVPVPEES